MSDNTNELRRRAACGELTVGEIDDLISRAATAERERDELRIDGSRLIRDCNEATARAEKAERAAAAKDEALVEVVDDGLATNIKRWQEKAAAALSHDAGRDFVPLAAHVALQQQAAALREALESLRDHQNGPPLPTWEAGWNDAMAQAEAALATVAGQGWVRREDLDALQAKFDAAVRGNLIVCRERDEWKAKAEAEQAESGRLMLESRYWHRHADEWMAKANDLRRRLGEAVEALKQLDKCAQYVTGKELRERMYGIVASVLDSAPSPAPEPAPAPAMLAPPASIVNAPIEKATFTEVRHLLSPAPATDPAREWAETNVTRKKTAFPEWLHVEAGFASLYLTVPARGCGHDIGDLRRLVAAIFRAGQAHERARVLGLCEKQEYAPRQLVHWIESGGDLHVDAGTPQITQSGGYLYVHGGTPQIIDKRKK